MRFIGVVVTWTVATFIIVVMLALVVGQASGGKQHTHHPGTTTVYETVTSGIPS